MIEINDHFQPYNVENKVKQEIISDLSQFSKLT
jgi:hypothetical protein